MTPFDLKGMLDGIRAYGLFVTLVILPGLALGSFLAFKYVKSWALRVYDLFEKMEKHTAQFQSMLAEIREAVGRFDGVFLKHVEDTERLGNEEHWKNCQVDKCPYLLKFFNRLEDIAQETRDFAEAAKLSREQTRELITILMRRLDDLFVQQIAVLRRNGCDK
jgi:hypothetical protein